MDQILLYDTTLRDGAQGENVTFTVEDKLRISKRLDDVGIHYIEGGWPGSNPKDLEFFKLARKIELKHAKLAAFGATRKPGISAIKDKNLKAILEAETGVVTIFGKTWDLHVEKVMNNSLEENIAMIHDSVLFLKDNGRKVIYDAEHFFDGYFANRQYALKTLMAAIEGGAETIVLCDTNGGTLPFDTEKIVQDVLKTIPGQYENDTVKIGIHSHNDCGVAVANSISAVREGAVMVHGTINGYGERCGNADLTSIIPILKLKMKYNCISEENMKELRKLSRFVSERANMTPSNTRPFVGRSAFAHKGGIHVSAITKTPLAYEHINPDKVGNKRRVLVSDLSGKSNIEYKAKELGIDLTSDKFNTQKIVNEVKRLEKDGYQFDAADGSLQILIEKFTNQYSSSFELKSFRVTIEKDTDRPCQSHAMIKISVDGKDEITAAEGNGPVSALDNALRKALTSFYPSLDMMHLVDFKVRVIDGRDGTSAKVRVLIESRDEDKIWSTVGVSEDIIEASWQALTDSFDFKISNE
jgi:2-isopropylmalate synthase